MGWQNRSSEGWKLIPQWGPGLQGQRPGFLRNYSIVFVSAVVNFSGLLMCYTTKKTGGVATYVSMSELQHIHTHVKPPFVQDYPDEPVPER